VRTWRLRTASSSGEYEKAIDSTGSALKRKVMIGFFFWLRI
jgi:hypothetical protein